MRKAFLLLTMLTFVFAVAACSSNNNGGNNNSTAGEVNTNTASETSDATDNSTASDNTSTDNATAKPEKVKLEYWHTYSDGEEKVLVDKIKPMFEQSHPNIELNLVRMPYEGLKDQVIAAVAGDAAPDLMRMDIIWVPELGKMGALAKLNDMPGFEDLKSTVFDGPLSTNQYDGNYYGVPLNTNTKVAIYNVDTLKEAGLTEPPATLDELVKAAEILKSKGKQGIGISGMGSWSILPYFWSLGGKLTSDDYKQVDGYLNSPETHQGAGNDCRLE